MTEYITVESPASDSFVEKRSRFIGYISPVKTEAEAEEFINQIKSKHYDARHNPYAYILREGQTFRFSDDGEPSQTAGKPILDVLQKEGLFDVAVVVTRYFGGILLGGGGLTRAYSHGAKLAVMSAQRILMKPYTLFFLSCDYTLYGKLTHMLKEYDAVIEESSFEQNIALVVAVEKAQEGKLEADMSEASNGALKPEIIGNKYLGRRI